MPYDLTCALISIIAFTVNMNGKFAQNFCSSAAYSIVSRILFFLLDLSHSHSKIIEIEKDNTTDEQNVFVYYTLHKYKRM